MNTLDKLITEWSEYAKNRPPMKYFFDLSSTTKLTLDVNKSDFTIACESKEIYLTLEDAKNLYLYLKELYGDIGGNK
jgi:hypothetical protein